MKYILSRLFGLLQRELDAYQRLHQSIEVKKQCLLTRSLRILQEALEAQKKIVQEIHDLETDRQEEYRNLSAYLIAHGCGAADTLEEMLAVVSPRDRRRWTVLRERLKRQIVKTRDLNLDNLRVVTISQEVFGTYLLDLANLCAMSGGYSAQGLTHATPGNAVLDQRT